MRNKKDWIIKRVDIWKTRMGLINWDTDIKFKMSDGLNTVSQGTGLAETVADPIYKKAALYFNPRKLDELTENDIVHELTHLLLSPVVNFGYDNLQMDLVDAFGEKQEGVTSEVTSVLMRLYKS